MIAASSRRSEGIALITQMRAGTHYLCAALRVAMNADLRRPAEDCRYAPMSDEEILKGLNNDASIMLPATTGERIVYFSHYYHPHHYALPPIPRILLIGFPLDSFYSDGIVFSEKAYDPGPSGARGGAQGYVLRFDSAEWRFLEPFMEKNANWLSQIAEGKRALIVRYEDFFRDFDGCARRLERFVGGFERPMPKPVLNPRRSYWTEQYAAAFDRRALSALCDFFAPAIERFYPERLHSLLAAQAVAQ